MSTAFHPQTDGQSERTIQVLEDMLRACVLNHKGSWEEHLPLVEFAYNNSYQASIQMAPYEALYGRPCRSPLCWTEVGESSITGPDLIRDTSEKVSLIRQRLLTAQSRQKSYVDVRRRPLEFEVGDHVFLKVMPKRGVVRFGKRGKLSPRFIGPWRNPHYSCYVEKLVPQSNSERTMKKRVINGLSFSCTKNTPLGIKGSIRLSQL